MTEQLNLWKAALQVAFDQTCSVGRPKDWKLIKDALDSVNAALTQPAQPAEGGEAIVLSADVREYLQEGIDNATQCEEADVDYAFAEGLAQLLGPLYTAPPASQEQAQQPSGGEVVAWTESKPKKPGVYGWRGSPASYDMVHVHTRPTEHSPGGQLNGSCLSGKGFYHGCAITSWGGEWIGPLDTLTLATPKPEPRRLGLVRDLLKHIEQNTCTHEETHRGGAIWEICNACGSMWADDKGGKPEFVWPDVVERAREYLAHHRITKGEA